MNVYVAWSLVLFVVGTAVLVPFLGADSRDGADWTPTAGRPERRPQTLAAHAEHPVGHRPGGPAPGAEPAAAPREPVPELAPDVLVPPRPVRLPRPRGAVVRPRAGSDI